VGSVDYVPEAYVYLHWSGAPLSSLEFRALYVHARNLLQRYRLPGILADHHAMPQAPAEDDRAWLLHEWLPQAVSETPFIRYAVMPTPEPNNRLHTDTVVATLRSYVTVELFDDLQQAVDWMSTEE
jgi:NhaA family Na+:H+ antiporter